MRDAVQKSLSVGDGGESREIAVLQRDGRAPGLVWLGGFKSDMGGGKAVALDRWAGETGTACTRFDYSGHGLSRSRTPGHHSDGESADELGKRLATPV